MNTTHRTFFDYLEMAAQSFDLSDIERAAGSLEDALAAVTRRRHPETTPHPFATHAWAEARKAVEALRIKDFHLSATLLRKALSQATPANLDHTVALSEAQALSFALQSENFSSVATHLRKVAELLDATGRQAMAGLS